MHALRGVFIASLLVSIDASGAEQDRPFQLKYEAPADCPSANDVSARIRASTAHARPAEGDERRYDMTVVVSRAETGFLAALAVRLPDGSETARTVPAPSCAEAVDAAALILAITIDPEAAAAERLRPDVGPNAKPPPRAEKRERTEPTPAKQEAAAPAPATATREMDRPPTKASGDRLLADAGAGFIALALAPELTPDFFIGFAYEPALGKVPPRFGFSVHVARSPVVEAPEGTAVFERVGGRLDACPLRAGSRDLSLRPCLAFEAGRFQGMGTGALTGQDQPVFWAATGAFLSGELRAPEAWAARAELGALFPLGRDEFYFDPGHHVVHKIPAVGVFMAVALELELL